MMKKVLKQLAAFTNKEFLHLLRDKRTLLIMFGLPIALVLIFGFALTNEVKNATLLVVNPSHDYMASQIAEKINASKYFTLVAEEPSTEKMEQYFKDATIQVALIFPTDFSSQTDGTTTVQVITDGTDPNFAKTVLNYISVNLADYVMEQNQIHNIPLQINTQVQMLYNPSLNGSMTFVPGLIALIMMIVCTTLTSVSIVREKELGTMEVLLVTPLKPTLLMTAKAIPYFVLSIADFIIILLLSYFVLDVPIHGSIVLLFLECVLYIITCLALGLLISNVSDTQTVAMLLSSVMVLLPILLLTGFLFPLENMPLVFQWMADIIPAKWFNDIVTGVMLKGVGIMDLWKETLILSGMAIFLLFVGVKTFKIRMA